jgi:hypothetical protein
MPQREGPAQARLAIGSHRSQSLLGRHIRNEYGMCQDS